MKKARLHKIRRKLICFFYINCRPGSQLVREIRRRYRLFDIRREREIFEYLHMD